MVQAQQAMQQAGGVGVVPSPRPGLPQGKPTQALPQQPMQTQGGYVMPHMHDLSDLDTVDDMEMDDPLVDSGYQQSGNSMQARYRQDNQSGRVTPLNLNLLQNQGFRTSQPGTPVTQGRPLQNNPTVSSVNTPTLTSHPSQQGYPHYRSTPDSSAPGTPAELDDSVVGGFGGMSMANNPLLGTPGYSSGSDMLELCIDEPAKRLFRPSGGGKGSQQSPHSRLGGGSQYGPNSEIAKRIREQQRLAGVPEPALKPDDEPKPFRCPVIGCEKAYKNQNGLKYHKSVCTLFARLR
jgi:transcription factor SFP1